MTLVSPHYWFFLITVLIFFYGAPVRLRWKILLISSLFFYTTIIPIYSLLIFYQSLVIYLFSKYLLSIKIKLLKKGLFFSCIFLSIAPLLFFKFLPIFNDVFVKFIKNLFSINPIENIEIVLPLGISFFTFTGLGYLIDIYNEKFKLKDNFGKILLFISFFPTVLSGPIERGEFLDQLRFKSKLNLNLVLSGVNLILWGSFMKLVLANNINVLIGPIIEDPNKFSGRALLFSILIFPFQVYGDLGGYSLIAIGSAKCFGLKIRQNFNNPFSALSMTDFWRRWHISLIQWINDYVFKPITFYLRGLKKSGIIIGLFITFLIAGLWHGISFGFVIWGIFQGIILTIEFLIKIKNNYFNSKPVQYFRRIFTYILFSFSLIFGGIFSDVNKSLIALKKIINPLGDFSFDKDLMLVCIFSIIIIIFKDHNESKFSSHKIKNQNLSKILRWGIVQFIILCILFFGVFNNNGFIYFQY